MMRLSVVRPKLVSNGCTNGRRISRNSTAVINTRKRNPNRFAEAEILLHAYHGFSQSQNESWQRDFVKQTVSLRWWVDSQL
jgi:hypothetical protein